MSKPNQSHVTDAEITDASWQSFYRVGATAALLTLLVVLLDMGMSALPGRTTGSGTLSVTDWFAHLRDQWFLGLRNLGVLNIVTTTLGVPLYLALYAAHRRVNRPYAALAAIIMFIGTAVYIANNQALPMLALSGQYEAATSEAHRSLLAAAGQTLLAQGEDFTPGAFVGFLLPSAAGIGMAIVMLQGRVFSRLTAWAGILGSTFLLIFTICATFAPATFAVAMIVAMIGGLLMIAWYILVARRLLQLSTIP